MSLTAEQKAATNAPYDPPKHISGQIVKWWENGVRQGRFRLAVVLEPGQRLSRLQLLTGELVSGSCAHIDDPKLKNPFQAQHGGWEHTEATIAEQRERNVLVRRVRAMEESLIRGGDANRDVLLVRAKAIGIKGHSTMKTDDLRKAIVKRMDELTSSLESVVDESQLIDQDADGEPEPPLDQKAEFSKEPEHAGA